MVCIFAGRFWRPKKMPDLRALRVRNDRRLQKAPLRERLQLQVVEPILSQRAF